MAYSVLPVNVFELQNSGVDNTYEKERVAQAKRIMKPFVLRRLKKDVSECLMIITLSSVFSFPYVTSLIRIRHPQPIY